jgi:Ca2+-binding EF-hand superfamily protein
MFPYQLAVACALMWVVTRAASAQHADAAVYFASIDLDGDGRISLAEFRDHMSRGFHDMDIDDNHILQGAELPVPGIREVRLEEHLASLARQFKRQDHDDNGFLDHMEFIALPR